MAAAKNMTPEQRVERARNAARAGQLNVAVKVATTRAHELTPDQRDIMIRALRAG